MLKKLLGIFLLITFIHANNTLASELSVEDILKEKQPPPGLVFEIVSGQANLLDTLLPNLIKDIKRLRKRFPELSIAIVTHGIEQFALTTNNRQKAKTSHSLVQQLVNKNDIKVHVCETFAGWQDISAEDFPDYIDVSATGPAQINDYLELDYELITLP